MDKMKMESKDLVNENIDRIQELFPGVVTESKDEKGRLIRAIDFDLLKQELSDIVVEGEKERYQLTWPGKKKAMLMANLPTTNTLRPVREDSVDWDKTENLFIEGDNLEALKILQESYLNQVKCIYIDPPYNTGKDFVYRDDFKQSRQEYLDQSGQMDEEGNRLFQNNESNGRFHSDWLSMMYPRLKLARNLLREDGVIFVSIDDSEVHNLRKSCDEVFGENNFIAQYIHKNNSSKNQASLVSVSTEYFFCYAKNADILKTKRWRLKKKGVKDIVNMYNSLKIKGLSIEEIEKEIKDMYKRPKYCHLSRWNKVDNIGIFVDADLSREGGPKNYTIINPYTNNPCIIPSRGWGKNEEELKKLQEQDLIWYGSDKTPPRVKEYISPDDSTVPDSFWYYDNSVDTRWIKNEFGFLAFENPKPLEMLTTILDMVSDKNDEIILDFFAGSATTAHAVMQLNTEDQGKRKYIMVQLPEPCPPDSEAHKAGYKNIAEIGKERIRRAARKIKEETGADIDYGFRTFRVDSSNMKDVYHHPNQITQDGLQAFETNIKKGRLAEDLLIQAMLDSGLQPSLPMKKKTVQGREVFFVAGNSLVACFDKDIPEQLIHDIAEYKPLRVVFQDKSFKDDAARINVDELFKTLSPGTEVKVI